MYDRLDRHSREEPSHEQTTKLVTALCIKLLRKQG